MKAFEGLLQRHGVTGVGVNAVLDSAGVGKRLLYEYFGDLEGLAAAWARDRPDPLALADRGEALRRRLEKMEPAERIGLITQDYACSLRDHPWASQVMLAELQRSNGIAKAMSEIRREIGAGHEGLLVNEDTRSNQALMEMAFILHAAANAGADILVAGAFGHPRLQEFIFGGTTRTLLNSDSPSLFLSH